MTKITFIEYLKTQNKLLSDIENRMSMSKEGEKYYKELINLQPSLEIVYPQETKQILTNLKINEKFTEILIEVDNKLRKIKQYKLDMAGHKVIVTDKQNKESEIDTTPMPSFIENTLMIKKDNIYYYTLLSYLCQIDRFEVIQLYLALKNK